MKKLTLLLTVVLISGAVSGQKFRPSTSITPYSSFEKMRDIPAESHLKSEGEVFFTETFNWKDPSNERGWSLPAGWQIVETTDYGMPWIWRAGSDSIRGRWTFEKGHKYSKSPDDGFIVFPADEYNYVDGVQTDLYPICYVQMPSVNCSNRPSVVLKMRQYFRCNPSTSVKILVSNDQGSHWATYSMAYETSLNIFCKNPFVEVNITDVAAGMSDVWIRFVWDGMRYYFWAIDDLTLSEAYNNEIQLERPWLYLTDLEEDGDEGFTFMVPNSQVGTDGFGGYTFKAGFLNAGRDDQEGCLLNAEVFRNGVSVYNKNSVSRDIWALQRDTFPITDQFVPDGYGSYDLVLTARQDQVDGIPENNIYKDTYYITDSVYSVSDWDFETYSSTAGFGNNDGDYLGVVYDIKKATEINSISTLIMQRPENKIASTKPGYSFQYWLFGYNAEESLWVELLASEYVEVTEGMLDKWITLDLEKDGESEFLTPGSYIAAIQVFHGGGLAANNSLYRFTIGSDNSHRQSLSKSVYRSVDDADMVWYQNRDISMIRMNINEQGAPLAADVQFNVDMSIPLANGTFNPAGGDFVDLAGTFNNWTGSAHLADPDGDHIYSLTVPALAIFENLGYKYRINGSWDTSEFPGGGPNRVYRTSYYNVVNDIYNNGISLGADENALTPAIRVYPNPTEGVFTLSITSSSVSGLNIQVANIQGQVVYRNEVKGAISHEEKIDLTHFAKGMYFLKVNNEVIKLVVK
jgi:hypothetical protein